jgi:hypothetical protein
MVHKFRASVWCRDRAGDAPRHKEHMGEVFTLIMETRQPSVVIGYECGAL